MWSLRKNHYFKQKKVFIEWECISRLEVSKEGAKNTFTIKLQTEISEGGIPVAGAEVMFSEKSELVLDLSWFYRPYSRM